MTKTYKHFQIILPACYEWIKWNKLCWSEFYRAARSNHGQQFTRTRQQNQRPTF